MNDNGIFHVPVTCLAAWFAIGLSCGSCGYRALHGSGGREPLVSTLSVPVVENLTPRAGLGPEFTATLKRRLAASGIEVVLSGGGEARLEAAILSVDALPGTLRLEAGRLAPVDSIWNVEVEASLVRGDGAVMRGPERFMVEGRSIYGDNPLAAEGLGWRAQAELLDTLARRVVESLLFR